MADSDKHQPPSANADKEPGQERQHRERAGSGDDAPAQDPGDPRSNERSEEQSGSRH